MSVYVAEMGWTFNVANPDAATNAPTIAAVGIVFTVFSALVVSLRLYVRSSIVKKISVGKETQLNISVVLKASSNLTHQMTGLSWLLG